MSQTDPDQNLAQSPSQALGSKAIQGRIGLRAVAIVLALSASILANCGGGGGSSSGGSGGGGGSTSSSSSTSSSPSGPLAKVYLTTIDQANLVAQKPDVAFDTQTPSGVVITVDPSQRFQAMVGYGAAMTDAAAYNIQQKMNPSQRAALITDLFHPTNGIGLSFMRLTIGASDFSRTHYSYNDMPAGATDMTLANFSIAPARTDVISAVKAAMIANPDLKLMASPWSAPGWMKTSDSLIGGALKPSAFGVYGDYLVKYLNAMQSEGVPIHYLSLQNEPLFTPSNYPGMSVSNADRAAFIGGFLGPKLSSSGLSTLLLEYDHNWDNTQAPLAVLSDATANPYISGVAWHCYAGDVSAQTTVRNSFPTKDVFFTECTGGNFAPNWGSNFTWYMRNLVIGAPRHWARGVLMWNLALDENFGPHLGGVC